MTARSVAEVDIDRAPARVREAYELLLPHYRRLHEHRVGVAR